MIDSTEVADDALLTMDRHLKTDLAALEVAIGKAREVILKPLHAAAHPGARRRSQR